MEEAGNYQSQQTDIRTDNKTWHVITHKWVLNSENTWTQGGEHHRMGPGEWRGRKGIAGGEGIGEG